MLRESPVRALTAGSLRIVVAMLGASLEFKGSQEHGEGVTYESITGEFEPGILLQELGLLLQQGITGNDSVMLR